MITRFAPSPSGFLHLGHAYAAYIAHCWAAHFGEKMRLRIEDINHVVSRDAFTAAIFEDLHWLDIPYYSFVTYQQPRIAKYNLALQRLIEMGVVYPCFCSRTDIRRAQVARAPHGMGVRYPETCRHLSLEKIAALQQQQKPFAYRLHGAKAIKITGDLFFHDHRFGLQKADLSKLGDMVIARKDGLISYHLAVVCDDAEESIGLVTRGEDLLEMTHLHVILQRLLGLDTPEYLHHHLMNDSQGVRLAKRADSVAIRAYRERGFRPEQIYALFPQPLADKPNLVDTAKDR